MRTLISINEDWQFCRQDIGLDAALKMAGEDETSHPAVESVTLPHTWNGQDGQDGGNDYYRGACWYCRRLDLPVLNQGEKVWLEFGAVSQSADVYLNGQLLAHHDGGYSIFRVNLTPALQAQNLLAVRVDNSKNRTVYPQRADFTFYGGITRDVRLIKVPASHFALGRSGSQGIEALPEIVGNDAIVRLEAWTDNTPDGYVVEFSIEGEQSATATVHNGQAKATIPIANVRRWDGRQDPFLYQASARLLDDAGLALDEISTRFGCRTFRVDPETGFWLNDRQYPLCGVSRHQDRPEVGPATTRAMQDEDMALILEMGANTIRLAHYQHDQYFYDLCDRHGLVVWAEIPYITEHLPEARDNTLNQMRELVCQNINHPSIVCWGLSNEITAVGGVTRDLVENHRQLNNLCHQLDPSRLTTMAHAFMLDMDDPLVLLPDIRSYNLYYGWYLGQCSDNDEWFDEFHAKYPTAVIGLSEYGADANPAFQTAIPEQGDWTETYQAAYHEHMLRMWQKRPYIWAMHVWNMFDFAADGRNEGGKPGQNQKGLVTFDRRLKKDAFYLYKAWLSDDPFVHICSRRYVDRAEAVTRVKVYSNQPEITLIVDGQAMATVRGDRVFEFEVPIQGEHKIEARSEQLMDAIQVRHVEHANPDYVNGGETVINWFDQDEAIERDGFYSIKDTMHEIKRSPEAAALLAAILDKARAAYGDVAEHVDMPASIRRRMDASKLDKVLRQAGQAISPEMVRDLNRRLNKIPKTI